jgi:hypothetical protein
MFHAKYLSPWGVKEIDFLRFYYIHIRKTNDPWGGPILTLRAGP